MSATFDLRRPIFVLTGLFNPAIFSPEWSAANLFEIPEGETINIAVAEGLGSGGATFFLKNIGVSINQTRLEFFANALSDEVISVMEKAALRVFEILPHTPFGAFGINLGLIDPEPNDLICQLFNSGEHLEEKYKMLRRIYKQSLELEDGTTLNLEKTLDDDGVFIVFDFHWNDINVENAAEIISEVTKKKIEFVRKFTAEFYELDSIGETSFPLPEM